MDAGEKIWMKQNKKKSLEPYDTGINTDLLINKIAQK